MKSPDIIRGQQRRWERLCSQHHELADAVIYYERMSDSVGCWRVGPCACSVTSDIAANEMIAAMSQLLMQQGWVVASCCDQDTGRFHVHVELNVGTDCYALDCHACARTALSAWLKITEEALAAKEGIDQLRSVLRTSQIGGAA